MEQVKLLSTTAVFTLLIWIGADQLLTVSATVDVVLSVAPAASDSTMLVSLIPPSPTVRVQVSGPRRVVSELEEASPIDVTIPVAELEPAERKTLGNLADLLEARRSELRDLTIEAVEPPSVNMVVDRWVSQPVALVIRRPLTLTYNVEPRLEPSQITVEMSELHRRRLGEKARQIELDVEPDLRGQPRGEPVTIGLPIPLSAFGPRAKASVETVQVIATLGAAQRRTVVVPTVPIRLAPAFSAFGRPLRATLPGSESTLVTRTLELTGADEVLNRLDPKNTRIYGVIVLTEADYERPGQTLVKVPEFVLPAGLEIVGEVEPVSFQLEPVPAAGGEAPAVPHAP